MRDLVTKKQEIKAPSRPVIVQVLSSLPAGTEIKCDEYASKAGEVFPAGTPVFLEFDGTWSLGVADKAQTKGVLVNDCMVYETEKDGEVYYRLSGAIMLAGVVNVDYYEDEEKSEISNFLKASPIVCIGKGVGPIPS